MREVVERLDWLKGALEQRTGALSTLARIRTASVPGGARWAHALAAALLVVLATQFVTGGLLAVYYVPSPDHAYVTVEFIQKEITAGWLVRGLHAWGASALVVLTVAHLAMVVFWGAYKGGREAVWLTGAILAQMVLAFAFTGYLLPWDQKAYFGTEVGANIAAGVPLAGPALRRAMLGGETITALTLTRFFALHALWLPAAACTFTAGHLATFARVGYAGSARGATRADVFYPKQLLRDTAAAAAVLGLLVVLSWLAPPILEPPADPTSDYLPRPEWYFLSLFELLKLFPASLAAVPGFVLPLAVFTLVGALPFLDRRPERRPRKRPIVVGLLITGLVTVGGLTIAARIDDWRDAETRLALERQARDARAAMEAPFEPSPLAERRRSHGGGRSDPPPAAFSRNCAVCHGAEAAGGEIGPVLRGIASKPKRTPDDIVALLADPRAYGLGEGMPAFDGLSEGERREIAEWLSHLARDAPPGAP